MSFFSLLFIELCGLLPSFLPSLTLINSYFHFQKNYTLIFFPFKLTLTMEINKSIPSLLLICFTFFMLFPFSYAAPLLDHEGKMTLPSSPRKLKYNEEPNVKSNGNQMNLVPLNTAQLSGKEHEGEVVHARKGTRQEWVEGKDTSDFFTMDYHWVRRRRPIHNKSIRP